MVKGKMILTFNQNFLRYFKSKFFVTKISSNENSFTLFNRQTKRQTVITTLSCLLKKKQKNFDSHPREFDKKSFLIEKKKRSKTATVKIYEID